MSTYYDVEFKSARGYWEFVGRHELKSSAQDQVSLFPSNRRVVKVVESRSVVYPKPKAKKSKGGRK